MKIVRLAFAFTFILGLFLIAGCGHKLVAHGGDTTVAVYPDKNAFDKVKEMERQGGPAGLIGGLGESMMTKKIDAGTPVKILTSDDAGYRIQVLEGPQQGVEGYVSKDSVD